MQARDKTNGLFGRLQTSDVGKITITEAGDSISDYVFRKTGLQESLVKAERYKAALDDPKAYLELKQANMTEIGTDLTAKFKSEYLRLLTLGYTEEKSRKIATDSIQDEKRRLMAAHELMFPTNITSDVVSSAFNLRGRRGKEGPTGPTGPKGDKGDDK